jgi:benzoyl-CoA reductase/2-hydroxyglutaryl-CoA dehydratase subunit BcrC/BadD/HgdB
MGIKNDIAKKLYASVDGGKMSLHSALKMYKPVHMLSARRHADSSRFMAKNLVEHLIAASAPGANAAWTSVLFPTEILYLFDVYPLTLEVVSGTFATLRLSTPLLDLADADDVPATMCSFHKILMGLSKTNFLNKPLVAGATSTMCDGNVKSFAEAAKEKDVPFLFIDVPFEESRDGIEYVKDQLKATIDTLSELTGIQDYQDKLKQIVANSNRAFELFREFYRLHSLSTKNLYRGHEVANFVFPVHFLLGSDRLIKMIESRCVDVAHGKNFNQVYKSLHYNKSAKRIMWLHIVPQYDNELWDIIDDGENAKIVCDEYSSPSFEDYDPADPLGSIAKRLINHPSNGPLERRINHILKVAKDHKIDGFVHFSSWGCHQASGNVQILARALQDAGYKFLNLDGDAVDERNSSFEQQRTRLEAFLEH